MRRQWAGYLAGAVVAGVLCVLQAGCERHAGEPPPIPGAETGEALFLRLCSGCHPGGRNVKYPAKSLDRMTLAANGVNKPRDIVNILRNPGPGMPLFDRARLSDREAEAVASYVFTTFK